MLNTEDKEKIWKAAGAGKDTLCTGDNNPDINSLLWKQCRPENKRLTLLSVERPRILFLENGSYKTESKIKIFADRQK